MILGRVCYGRREDSEERAEQDDRRQTNFSANFELRGYSIIGKYCLRLPSRCLSNQVQVRQKFMTHCRATCELMHFRENTMP